MPDELAEQIEENAQSPRRVRGDEGEVEQQPLRDQIDVDRYLSSRDAVDASKSRGLRFMKIKPPGAV